MENFQRYICLLYMLLQENIQNTIIFLIRNSYDEWIQPSARVIHRLWSVLAFWIHSMVINKLLGEYYYDCKSKCHLQNCTHGHVHNSRLCLSFIFSPVTLSIQKEILNLCRNIDVYEVHRKQTSMHYPSYWKFLVAEMQTWKLSVTTHYCIDNTTC